MPEELEQTDSTTGHEEEADSSSGQEEQIDSSTDQGEGSEQRQYTDYERQLYARATKAEQELKKYKAKEQSPSNDEKTSKEEKIEEEFSGQDPFELAKTVQALKDYSADEIDIIKKHATAFNISPAKAANSEDVQALIKHRRDKAIKSEANPTPTNRQQPTEKDFSSWTQETVHQKFNEGEQGRKELDEYQAWLQNRHRT